jgi:hypothetical protein
MFLTLLSLQLCSSIAFGHFAPIVTKTSFFPLLLYILHIAMASLQSGQGKIHLASNDNDYYFKVSDVSVPNLAGLLEFSNTKDFGK